MNTPSAMGERQMLPRQMKRIERGGAGGGIDILRGDDGGLFLVGWDGSGGIGIGIEDYVEDIFLCVGGVVVVLVDEVEVLCYVSIILVMVFRPRP